MKILNKFFGVLKYWLLEALESPVDGRDMLIRTLSQEVTTWQDKAAENFKRADALEKMLDDCVDSLEYVNRMYGSEVVGWGVREDRIDKARKLLATKLSVFPQENNTDGEEKTKES